MQRERPVPKIDFRVYFDSDCVAIDVLRFVANQGLRSKDNRWQRLSNGCKFITQRPVPGE